MSENYDMFKIIGIKAPLPWDIDGLTIIDSDGDVFLSGNEMYNGEYSDVVITQQDAENVLKRIAVWANLFPYMVEALEISQKELNPSSEAFKKVARVLKKLNTNLDNKAGWEVQEGLDDLEELGDLKQFAKNLEFSR